MDGRCRHAPASSIPVAIARLNDWKWIICQRGYANIVRLPSNKTQTKSLGANKEATTQNSVWGVIYDLDPADEDALDGYEGASANYEEFPEPNPDQDEQERQLRPHLQGDRLYNKQYLCVTVEKWLRSPGEYGVQSQPQPAPASFADGGDRGGSGSGDAITVLVYVDEKRTLEGTIQESYIGRMNRAIDESVPLGIPQQWVDEVMRRWIPVGMELQQPGWVGEVPGHENTWAATTEAAGWNEQWDREWEGERDRDY